MLNDGFNSIGEIFSLIVRETKRNLSTDITKYRYNDFTLIEFIENYTFDLFKTTLACIIFIGLLILSPAYILYKALIKILSN